MFDPIMPVAPVRKTRGPRPRPARVHQPVPLTSTAVALAEGSCASMADDEVGVVGPDLRAEAADDLAVGRHQELLEVPLHVARLAVGSRLASVSSA